MDKLTEEIHGKENKYVVEWSDFTHTAITCTDDEINDFTHTAITCTDDEINDYIDVLMENAIDEVTPIKIIKI